MFGLKLVERKNKSTIEIWKEEYGGWPEGVGFDWTSHIWYFLTLSFKKYKKSRIYINRPNCEKRNMDADYSFDVSSQI